MFQLGPHPLLQGVGMAGQRAKIGGGGFANISFFINAPLDGGDQRTQGIELMHRMREGRRLELPRGKIPIDL